MELSAIGRLFIIAGILLVAVGVVFLLAGKVPFLGRLPGDLVFHRDGFTLFVPIVTMIIISVVLTIVLNLIFRIFR